MFFFFNDTATTEIYTLSLHDALPICGSCGSNLGIARQYLIGFADASATVDLNRTGGITLADRSMIHSGGGYLPSPVPLLVDINGPKQQGVGSGTSCPDPPGLLTEKGKRS